MNHKLFCFSQGFHSFCSFSILFFLGLLPSTHVIYKAHRNASSSPIQFISSTLYGPYSGGESVTFTWSYINNSGNNYTSVNDYFIVNCPSYSSSPLISKRVSRHSLSSGSRQDCSYTYKIPEARFNSESGIIIKVGVFYQSSYLSLLEKTIKPIAHERINPLTYRSSAYEIKDRSFYLNETDVSESFLFDEYRDYVECDKHYRLLFNNLSFLYKYPTSLTYIEARLKFIDKYYLYPNIHKDGDGYSEVDISLVYLEERVSIEVNNIYVNPITLQCYQNKSEDNKKSRYLFVPKGKGKQIEEYEFIIEVEEIGINKTSFSHCLEVSISPYFLGSCEDADYCVVGGVKA